MQINGDNQSVDFSIPKRTYWQVIRYFSRHLSVLFGIFNGFGYPQLAALIALTVIQIGECIVFLYFLNNPLATINTFNIQFWIDRDNIKLITQLMFISLILKDSFVILNENIGR